MDKSVLALIERMQRKAEAKTKNANQAAKQKGRNVADNSVTKSNALARAYYRYSLSQKRCMEALISQLHPQRHDNDLQDIELTAVAYSKAYNVALPNAYTELATAVHGLMHSVITVPESDNDHTELTLMIQAKYKKSEGRIICTFSPLVVPHLIGLRQKFTRYPLSKAVHFKSSYTWRFYELLVSWAQPFEETDGLFAGWFSASVDKLRLMLGVPENYRFDDFQRRVLNVVVQELTNNDIQIDIERVKTSRRVTGLKIRFIENKPKPDRYQSKEKEEVFKTIQASYK